MCAPDPNAGIRRQAKQRHLEKAVNYNSAALKYWNRETTYVRGKQAAATGFSRAQSDTYSKAVHAWGEGNRRRQDIARAYMQKQVVADEDGVGRSRSFGRTQKLSELLSKQSRVDELMKNTFGRNMDIAFQGHKRTYEGNLAKNRSRLGVKPEYGAPVMMPPKDKAGQFLANLQTGLSIGTSLATMGVGAPASAATGSAGGLFGTGFLSDIKAKENISTVGKSPQGYTIYEWNYKSSPNTRYRGVIAQNVMKINPMAVGIRKDGYLGVDYSQLDVDMEVVT